MADEKGTKEPLVPAKDYYLSSDGVVFGRPEDARALDAGRLDFDLEIEIDREKE